jgi:hypothetical protein
MTPRSFTSIESSISAIQSIVQNNFIAVGNTMNVPAQKSATVIINQYWRRKIVQMSISTFFKYQTFMSNLQSPDLLTKTLTPFLAHLTPNVAAYLKAADFQQLDQRYSTN